MVPGPEPDRSLAELERATAFAGAAPDTSTQETRPVVTGYEVLGQLGRGGMGVVFQARQLSLDRLVALKFLPDECRRDPVWLECFRREALTASGLNHPNICTIYDTGESDGRPFFSMELIEGQTLDALVGKTLSVEELVCLIGQVARALAAAHTAGVIHRDIKPQNLMVRGDGIVKVLDFGLAGRLHSGSATSAGKDTDPNVRKGTILYMSPEQTRAEAVSSASDIFSLGVTLYELTTGQHPFLTGSESAILHAINTQTPVPPSRLRPEIPEALDDLTQHMLEKDPRLRPSAVEVDAALVEQVACGRSRPATPPPRAQGRRTVGRHSERAALRAGFEQAATGSGLVLCVTGEPGLGKTTLVEDFLDSLTADGRHFGLAQGHCSERLAGAEAYLPFLEALGHLLQGPDGPSAAQVLRLLAPTWYVQLAPLNAEDPSLKSVLNSAREVSQARRKRELGVFLEEMSRRRPFVLFLDDVHWADPSSVDLLAYLGSKCAAWRLLLILTYRPSDLLLSQHPFWPVKLDLQGRGICREIELPFLSRTDLERYLSLSFAGHQFPEEFVAVIHARTEGNPLFMADLLRSLHDRGILAQDGDGWVLARAVPDLERDLPETVRGMVQRKLAQLSETDHRLLTAASVQGPEFDSAILARVLAVEAAVVEERLDVLERVHALVRLVQEQEFPDRTLTLRYRFVHILYQYALDAELRPTQKARWSAATAQALLTHFGDSNPVVATELALLFEAARDHQRAIDFYLLAARNKIRLFAYQEAEALARRGLALLPRLAEASIRQELSLLLTLGVALVSTRGFAAPEVEQTYLRARDLCQRTEDIPTLFPVLYGLWNVYLLRCDLKRCHELAEQLFSLAQDHPAEDFLLVSHNALQQPLFHVGHLSEARQHQELGLARYDPRQHRSLTTDYGEDPGVGYLVYGAVTLWHLGYPDQALQSAQAARRLANELSDPFNVARSLYFGAFTHLCRREVRATQELSAALMELSREHDFALMVVGGNILHGWSLTQQGELERGMSQIRQGLADWKATGALSHRPFQLALLAEALAADGRTEESLTAVAEALALSSSTGERFWEAELHRLQGEFWLKQADTQPSLLNEVETSFHQALTIARQQSARSLELRAVMSLSRLYRRLGRTDEARTLLTAITDWFTEGFETRDLQEAKSLLNELA